MKYRKIHNYKYQVMEDEKHNLGGYCPNAEIQTRFIAISDCVLKIKAGYCWDGPSGPTLDTPNTMTASLIHDALYQLIRMGKLPPGYRLSADQIFRSVGIEKGMYEWRANLWFRWVRRFAWYATRPKDPPKTLSAP